MNVPTIRKWLRPLTATATNSTREINHRAVNIVAKDVANGERDEFKYFCENIFVHTLKWEGGSKLHKVSGDSGGWTKYGIAYNKNRKLFNGLADFKDTTYEEAAQIAFVKYYKSIYAQLVPSSARLLYFDISFNMGSGRAIRYAQKCVGTKADGIIGDVTKRLLVNLKEPCLYKRRKSFYYWLVNRNSRMAKFLRGWMNRTESIYKQKY